MKIKELKKILEQAPDQERDVYIPTEERISTTDIDYNFDDNNDLDLYVTNENF